MKQIVNNHSFTFKNVLDTPFTLKLLEWRNQDFVRENMVDDRVISEENHMAFLEKLKTDDSMKVYLAFYDNKPVAVMTFRYNNNIIESGSYIIDKDDLSKGFGVVTGYARFEYIFGQFPDSSMQTVILEHNKKNIRLQENFGCILDKTIKIKKTDGTIENAFVYTMKKTNWEQKKEKVEMLVSHIVPIGNIGRIG